MDEQKDESSCPKDENNIHRGQTIQKTFKRPKPIGQVDRNNIKSDKNTFYKINE